MTAFSTLVPRVVALAGEVPITHVTRALRDAAAAFCRNTDAYRYEPAIITSVVDSATYALDIPADTHVSRIITARYGDVILEPTSTTLQQDLRKRLRKPEYFRLVGDNIQLFAAPPEVLDIVTEVALYPTFTATAIEDAFFEEWFEAFVAGAAYRVLSMPNTRWTDYKGAEVFNAKYLELEFRATSRAQGDNTPKVRVTAYGGL